MRRKDMNLSKLSVFFVSALCELVIAQPKESMCEHAPMLKAYDVLGDCFWYGVTVDKDVTKAKKYYLHAAMQVGEQGEVGKLRAGRRFLFDSDSPLEKAMGLYILKEFSDREDVEKVDSPKYEGHYNRRSSARYLMATHWAQSGDYRKSEYYLRKALEDNYGPSAFALIYLSEAGKLSSIMNDRALLEYMSEGVSKQKEFFFWEPHQDYSCWLKNQNEGRMESTAFPVDSALVFSLLEKHGPCSSISEEQ